MKKQILVLHKENWQKDRTIPITKKFPYLQFEYHKIGIDEYPTEKRRKNTYVSNEFLYLMCGGFDGVCLIDELPEVTVRGNHYGQWGKSLMQVKTKKRNGVQLRGAYGFMYYKSYPFGENQLEYTFEHELGHAVPYLYGFDEKQWYLGGLISLLHVYVKFGRFNNFFTDFLTRELRSRGIIE